MKAFGERVDCLPIGVGADKSVERLDVSQFEPAHSFSFRHKARRPLSSRQATLVLSIYELIHDYCLPCPNYIKIDVPSYFRREGNDIFVEVPLTIAEAVLGSKVDVPALDGSKITVKIPPGTASGTKRLRLRGKGVAGGDQYIDVKIVPPTGVDDKSKQLLEEFAKRNSQTLRDGPPWA